MDNLRHGKNGDGPFPLLKKALRDLKMYRHQRSTSSRATAATNDGRPGSAFTSTVRKSPGRPGSAFTATVRQSPGRPGSAFPATVRKSTGRPGSAFPATVCKSPGRPGSAFTATVRQSPVRLLQPNTKVAVNGGDMGDDADRGPVSTRDSNYPSPLPAPLPVETQSSGTQYSVPNTNCQLSVSCPCEQDIVATSNRQLEKELPHDVLPLQHREPDYFQRCHDTWREHRTREADRSEVGMYQYEGISDATGRLSRENDEQPIQGGVRVHIVESTDLLESCGGEARPETPVWVMRNCGGRNVADCDRDEPCGAGPVEFAKRDVQNGRDRIWRPFDSRRRHTQAVPYVRSPTPGPLVIDSTTVGVYRGEKRCTPSDEYDAYVVKTLLDKEENVIFVDCERFPNDSVSASSNKRPPSYVITCCNGRVRQRFYINEISDVGRAMATYVLSNLPERVTDSRKDGVCRPLMFLAVQHDLWSTPGVLRKVCVDQMNFAKSCDACCERAVMVAHINSTPRFACLKHAKDAVVVSELWLCHNPIFASVSSSMVVVGDSPHSSGQVKADLELSYGFGGDRTNSFLIGPFAWDPATVSPSRLDMVDVYRLLKEKHPNILDSCDRIFASSYIVWWMKECFTVRGHGGFRFS